MKTAALPSIYGYNDFRRFLADYQKTRGEYDPEFTKSEICKRLGIPNTRSYLNDVINGRPVSSSYAERFAKVFELNKDETRFFLVLVKYNQAENNGEKELYLEQLISLNKTPKKILDEKAFAFFREWHHSVIRALLDVVDFTDDYEALGKILVPPVTPKKVKESIALLKTLGLIEPDEKGRWKPSEKSITTSDGIKDDLIYYYQAQCLELARLALLKRHEQPQNVSTNIISISRQGYERIVRKIGKFRSEIRSLVHKDGEPSDGVYQLNIQLFSTAKIPKQKNAEN
jgi:uncharacterized protein (TIGR02147 family)